MKTTSISISLEPSYYENMLRPYNLDGKNVKTVTTTCLEQQPLQDREKLDPQQHHYVQNYCWTTDMGKFGQTRLDVCGKTTFF